MIDTTGNGNTQQFKINNRAIAMKRLSELLKGEEGDEHENACYSPLVTQGEKIKFDFEIASPTLLKSPSRQAYYYESSQAQSGVALSH